MIGQEQLLNKITTLIEEDKFPRFSILVGLEGSGRKTISKEIAKRLNAQLAISGIKVDDIRNTMKLANSNYLKTLYVFPESDKMSNNAENALLKFLEEPPNNAYIILTVDDLYSLLYTIRSRGTVFTLDMYKPSELFTYFWQIRPDGNPNDAELVQKICETPGEVESLADSIQNLYDYAQLVYDNIGEVAGANALKIGSKIALKDEEDKFDLKAFFKVFTYVCFEHLGLMPMDYVVTTIKYQNQLKIKGVNKPMLFDNWVLDMREIYFNYKP